MECSARSLELDPHYFYGFELTIIDRERNSCPLKPGFICNVPEGQSSPCLCPKVQSHSYHADRGMHRITGTVRFDAPGTAPALPNQFIARTEPDSSRELMKI